MSEMKQSPDASEMVELTECTRDEKFHVTDTKHLQASAEGGVMWQSCGGRVSSTGVTESAGCDWHEADETVQTAGRDYVNDNSDKSISNSKTALLPDLSSIHTNHVPKRRKHLEQRINSFDSDVLLTERGKEKEALLGSYEPGSTFSNAKFGSDPVRVGHSVLLHLHPERPVSPSGVTHPKSSTSKQHLHRSDTRRSYSVFHLTSAPNRVTVQSGSDQLHKETACLRAQSCPDIGINHRGKRTFGNYLDTATATSCGCSMLGPTVPAVLEGVDETAVSHDADVCSAGLSELKTLLNRPVGESDTFTNRDTDEKFCNRMGEYNFNPVVNGDLNTCSSGGCAKGDITKVPRQDHSQRNSHNCYPHLHRNGCAVVDTTVSNCDSNNAISSDEDHELQLPQNGSVSQRKRKFRRRNSSTLALPYKIPGKWGQTKKLCKDKKKNTQYSAIPSSGVALSSPKRRSLSSRISLLSKGNFKGLHLKPAQVKRADNSKFGQVSISISAVDSGTYSDTSEANSYCVQDELHPTASPSPSPSSLWKKERTRSIMSETSADRSVRFEAQKCRHIQRRCSQDKFGALVDGGEFTVVPVNNETNLREQTEGAPAKNSSNSLRVPLTTFDIDGEPTDTLTQNSITSLLSAKFRDVAKRWKQYGVDSPRFRKRLHSKWESMNYEEIDSQLQRKENEEKKSKKRLSLEMLSSWVIYFFIGIGTAFLAAGVQISVELVAHQKFGLIRDYMDKCDKEDCLIQPVMIWMGINLGITLLGAALVTYVQPMAAGSGIPLIKSYLNGIRVPGLLSLRAFIAKCIGVILSILGGLACGKEGPMAHSGGIVAAGLGKGRIPWFKKDISLYSLFRTDHNIRDLVAAGAASGVSAAFGAPVGGTLFSVEEAASFWNTELVWKVFFSAMIACFSTNVLISAFEGHPTQLSNPGLVRFNTFPNLTFDLIEIPVFIIMAALGGLIGSLFVVMNYKLTVFRQKYLHRKKWIKVVEAGLVAVVSAAAAFILMFAVKDCTDAHPFSHHAITTKMGCSGESHNSMSTLYLATPEGCLKSLLHDPLETHSVLSLVLFIIVFFLLGVWTYGLSVSSGVFIPSLAIGAAWGRLIGLGVVQLFPDQAKDVGKYALIGAASQLGGILRTTISLTVIIVECTGDITFGLCIMISLMISKWVGDFFTTGLYDMNVEVSGLPLLSWEPPPLCEHIHVSDFMSQPVMTLLPVEKVGHVYDCLSGETFHGFPVIEQDPSYDIMYKGKLKGVILRHQLLVLLKKKVFCPEGQVPAVTVTLKDFENPYPVIQTLKIQDIQLTEADKDCVMDITPYMNLNPYTVSVNFSMPRVFRLFRGLGLRHLVVVNDNLEPIGMVTRKDLAKYRAEIKKGMLHMEQLTVENR